MIQSFQRRLTTLPPKRLFLLDSAGALLSAALLGLVLARLEPVFGMPPKVLYLLAAIACVFCLYSLLCYLSDVKNWRLFLKLIALANLLYCGLTLGLVVHWYERLTVLGVAYFVLEVVVVVLVVSLELRAVAGSG